jgi:hypothetical protein
MRSNGNEFRDAGIVLAYSQSRNNQPKRRKTPKGSDEDRLRKGPVQYRHQETAKYNTSGRQVKDK